VDGGQDSTASSADASTDAAVEAGAAVSVSVVTVALVTALTAAGFSQRRALAVAGMSRSSWHYRSRPRPRVTAPVPHRARRAQSWLEQAERDSITGKLKAAFGRGESVYQGYYQALDAGDPVASLSSWYRIARQLEPDRPVRRRARHRASAIPCLLATGPLQVWSWDITKLKGPYTRVTYELYLAVDVFSRLVVAWRVEDRESDELAKEMFQSAFHRHRAHPQVVHSDGGPSMTSNTLTGLFRGLGVEVSRNRPRVSNDNPYSESLFKTAKYTPTYPAYFTSIGQARAWVSQFVHWYNHEHRHTGLEGHTPATVHDGSWVTIHHQRVATMTRLHTEHPERFTKPPTIRTPMAQVAINHQISPDRLQTG
jgi:transposase InsO family protein